MTCAHVQETLDDYLDGSLAEGEFQEIELHLSGCPECRDEERLLRALLAHAAALPIEVAPGRDLWPGIAARLNRTGNVVAFPARRRWTLGALAAAAAVIVALASITGGPRSGGPVRGPSADRPGGTVLPVSAGAGDFAAAEAEYGRAATTLLAALDERRAALSPETLAAVDQNLQVIDAALAEVREALRKDPGNRQLTTMLASTHQKKVDVLRRVVRLSTQL